MPDNARINELKAKLQEKATRAEEILASITDEGEGKYVMSTEQKSEWDKVTADADSIKGLLTAAEQAAGYHEAAQEKAVEDANEMEAKSFGLMADAIAAFREGGAPAFAEATGTDMKSIGEMAVESKAFQDYAGRGESEAFEVKDVYTTLAPTVTNLGFGRTEREPMLLRQHRTQRVRDLFGSRTTTANLIEFYKVTGLVNNAGPVPERDTTPNPDVFGLKPQSSLTFDAEQSVVRTLAHWEGAHRNVLADEPQLRSIIDNELLYGLRLTEDAQILSGSGTGENIRGLLNTPDIQTYNWSDGPEWGPAPAITPSADNKADAVRRAITKVILSNYEATGVVLHPLDWEDIELAKDDNARYLITVAVAIGAEQRLWRLPVVDTPVIPQGTFLTGAFGLGAQIWDREGPSIRMTDTHADWFIRNAVVILAEQRLALTVKRPESFVKGTFDAAPEPAAA